MNLSWLILIGLLFDAFSLVCIVGQVVGYSDRPGLPIGPVFYFFGFVSMLHKGNVSVHLTIIVLSFCMLFFLVVIFSGILVYHCIKIYRRYKATEKMTYISNSGNEPDATGIIEKAIDLLVSNKAQKTHEGFVYLRSDKAKSNRAILHLMPSGNFEIQVTQSDPGYIKDGYFGKQVSSLGFPVENWKIGKLRQLIVPSEEHNRIPDFINLLFEKIYGEGDNYKIIAEVFVSVR